MAGWAPAEQLFGLHVDFGHQARDGRWLRPPVARYACRHGCLFESRGADQVRSFTALVDAHHARHCPGPPQT